MYALPGQKKARDFIITAEMVMNRNIIFPLEKAG
jgi:hypothetical protein